MIFVIQRVTGAKVTIDGEVRGEIGRGHMVLIGVADTDTKEIADKMVRKMCNLRIFEDENGKTNLSLAASEMYEYIIEQAKGYCPDVQRGEFGADMKVSLTNDGPFTIVLNSKDL